jgi:Mrp family chromosome partitioning ATPase
VPLSNPSGSVVLQSNKNVTKLNENGLKNGYSVKPLVPQAQTTSTTGNTPILANLSTNLASAKPKSALPQQKEATPAQVTQPVTVNMPFIESLTIRLSNNTEPMISPVKLLDENLQWHDGLLEFLTDQPDFLVVGVLGKKGVGKSTLMSLLAGSKFEENDQILFKSLSSANSDLAQHKTNGIQAFVTNERTIFLDVQVIFHILHLLA